MAWKSSALVPNRTNPSQKMYSAVTLCKSKLCETHPSLGSSDFCLQKIEIVLICNLANLQSDIGIITRVAKVIWPISLVWSHRKSENVVHHLHHKRWSYWMPISNGIHIHQVNCCAYAIAKRQFIHSKIALISWKTFVRHGNHRSRSSIGLRTWSDTNLVL